MNTCKTFMKMAVMSIVIFITGCGGTNYAPVVSLVHQAHVKNGQYVVQRGDTLYSIAWAFNLDYRDLARVNHLSTPFSVYPGQKLSLRIQMNNKVSMHVAKKSANRSGAIHARTHKKWPEVLASDTTDNKKLHHNNTAKSSYVAKKNMNKKSSINNYSKHLRWSWPAQGKVIKTFRSNFGANNGIDISGHSGEAIRASASGVVVYSGSGVRGYGNLLIIKHNEDFLSAYAFNRKLFVKQGARVRVGQKIATMGLNNQGKSILHFEIRKNGNPINPLLYLSRKKLA